MGVVSSYQLQQGYKQSAYSRYNGMLMPPYQFLPEKEKTLDYSSAAMNYIEYEGIRQLRMNANKLLKNYKMANGEIEKTDYIKTEGEYAEIVQQCVGEGQGPNELRYYSLTDTIVNVLTNEFSTRNSHITFDLRDEVSQNELFQQKYDEVDQALQQRAAIQQYQKMLQMGIAEDSEEGKQMMDPKAIKSLPNIQKWYNEKYTNELVDWATHQMNADNDRFHMDELERLQFRNMLITDREFWHFRMGENDYEVEALNPVLTFYKKAPRNRYVSEGIWAGTTDLWTVTDVVNTFGYLMTEDQLKSLDTIMPTAASQYIQDGVPNDGAMYDNTQSWAWNRQGPGLGMRQFMSGAQLLAGGTGGSYPYGDVVYRILGESEDMNYNYRPYMVRVSTIYWKTQRKVGRLVKKDLEGNQIQDIVTEEYKVTEKPVYDTINYKEKSNISLIYGEHIDWTWIPEVWGGYKIGPALPTWVGASNNQTFSPIYLGLNGGLPGRLPFQFKGTDNMYGCKLPIEGAIFNDYNTKSRSLVDRLAAWQIGYNMSLNMAMDINIDELGMVIIMDQNVAPKHSLGEEWGENNFVKAVSVMRDLSVLPVDTTRGNTEMAVHQNFVQKMDLSQSERILTKFRMADYYRQGALAAVGLTPERMGTPIDREQTATEINQSIASSFSQTEQYYIDHSDHLMPRVHQMRTDLAQYYNSTNPSIRLQYSTSDNSKVNFIMNGTKLLNRDFGVVAKTKVNTRHILNQIKQMLVSNNTSGANIFDLVRGIKADTISEIDQVMNTIEKRMQMEGQQKMTQEQQQFEMEQEQMWRMHEDNQAFEAEQNDLDRQNERYIAEVRAAVATGTEDMNANAQNDYLDTLQVIQQQNDNREKMNLEQQKHLTETAIKKEELSIRRSEIAAENTRSKVMAMDKKVSQRAKDKQKKK